jgi:TRAP transporter TAXI family solute receptor
VPAWADDPAPNPVRVAQASNATVGLAAGEAGSTDARVAAEIAIVLNDADRLRILPVQDSGSIQTIADLLYQKGVDLAIVHADALAQTMQRGVIPKEGSVQYVAKLFQEEIHLLARSDIASLSALNGEKVAIGRPGSGTELTGLALFDALNITPSLQHDSEPVALERLRHGDVAAMLVVGGKPVPLLQTLPPGSGLHFLPIPLSERLVDSYLPTKLDYQQYPNLVGTEHAIDTVAIEAVLVTVAAAPDTARARRVNRFVDILFDRFAQFGQAGFHPKWSEVNLFAQFPGWTRYPEAQALQTRQVGMKENDLRSAFNVYLTQTNQSVAGLNAERQQALFQDFLRWRDKR